MTEIKVKNAVLYEECGKYYMNVTYLVEDDRCVREVRFPKIPTYLEKWTGNVNLDTCESSMFRFMLPESSIELGNLLVPLETIYDARIDEYYVFKEKIIKEKTHDMTIEEIEKKLGYKIRIVNKK